MAKPTLEDRKATIEKEGVALQEKHKEIAEKRAILDKQLSQIQTGLVQLQGQYRLVEDMIKTEVEEKKDKNKKK